MENIDNKELKAIADNTIRQLGGYGKLCSMIGAGNFSYSRDKSVTFDFHMCRKANVISVRLNERDLYDVTFRKRNRRTFETVDVKTCNDVYCDKLKETIEEYTGLFLSL